MSGYVVSEWGWHAAFWIGSGLGLCLSFMIREMKTVTNILVKLSGMMKTAGQMSLLKISFLSILAHGMIFTTMFGFTTAYALRIGVSEKESACCLFVYDSARTCSASDRNIVRICENWITLKLFY